MPAHLFSIATITIFVALWFLIIIRFLMNRLAPVRTVQAEVVDKSVTESFSKYRGSGKVKRYVIVFRAKGKKLSFYVGEFSYGGYRIGEKGTLQYKGDRIIDFG